MPKTDPAKRRDARKPSDADRFAGRQIRKGRRELGLTQDALATLVGVTFQQIQKYEAGHSRLSAGRLRDVAIALQKPVEFFYEPFNIESTVPPDTQREMKIRDLRRDGKRLIDRIDDDCSLKAAVCVLSALERTA